MQLNVTKNPITAKKGFTDRIVYYCLHAIVFLFPLLFFPNIDTILEIPKLFVFGIFVVIATMAWMVGSIFKREISLKLSSLNIFVLVFGLLYLIATLFSVDRFTSFTGNGLSHGSLISVLFGIVFYFLVINTIKDVKEAWELIRAFLFSGLLILVFNLSQLFDVHIFSFDFAANNAFNLVANSVSVFVIYTVILFMIAFGFLVKSTKRIDRILSEVVLILVFAILFFLDKQIGWYLLIAGMFIWLVFLSMQSKRLRSVWIIIPTVFLVISLGFLFFSTSSITSVVPAKDVKLDLQTAWQITKSGGMQMFLFGSGPETYLYDFTEYRPAEFNNLSLWQLRFDRSYNELFQLFATTGFFITLLFIVLFVWPFLKIGKKILQARLADESWFYIITVAVSFFILFLSTFLHHFSSATYFLFWLLLALCGGVVSTKTKKISFQKSPQGNFAFSLIFAFALVASVSFLYFSIRVLASEINYANAKEESQSSPGINALNQYLENSVEQAPWNAQYHISLAEQYIFASTLDSNAVQGAQYLEDAKSEAEQAIKVSPKNVAIIEQAAEIYRVINNLNGPASVTEVFDIYKEAIKLDPNNAYLLYSVSNVYYSSALALGESESITPEIEEEIDSLLATAEQFILDAVDLRENFWEAELVLAKVLKRKDDTAQAVNILTTSANLNPYNLTLREELGIRLIDMEELEKAKEQLQIIISLQPNHANAHFWLAVVYELQDDIPKAISELEMVLETNPENEQILQKLSGLRGE
ncbi:hypothetical protein KJ705_02400 [Patescibacteria group bacterium]|nr:hypothetical protein [Patescibacteria group bacterium]